MAIRSTLDLQSAVITTTALLYAIKFSFRMSALSYNVLARQRYYISTRTLPELHILIGNHQHNFPHLISSTTDLFRFDLISFMII
jgi:hypothetical protein